MPEFLAVISKAVILCKFFKKEIDASGDALDDILKLLGLANLHLEHLKVVVVLVIAALAVFLCVFGVIGASEGGLKFIDFAVEFADGLVAVFDHLFEF